MIILDRTKPPPPILVHTPKPKFRTDYERDKYWAEEKRRWIEGFNGVPGTLYYKTQEQWIKNRVSGLTFRPECRDADLFIHERIEHNRKIKRMLGILKSRGLANYFMRVYPGSKILVTSQEQSKISSFFTDKVMVPYLACDPEIQPIKVNKNETKSTAFLRTQIVYKDADGKEATATSEILCKETSESMDSPSAFSGNGAIFGFYDEFALHKRKKALLQSSIECYKNPTTGELDGFLLYGGTVEATLTNIQIGEFQALVRDSEIWDTDILFIPFWMGKFTINGHSDEKKATEWWNREYEKFDKLEDKSFLRSFQMNNPRSLEDIFDLAEGGRWESDVQDKLALQRKDLLKDPPIVQQGRLVGNAGNSVFMPGSDKNSNVHILEHPKGGVEYYQCIDGVATGTKTGDDGGSNVASVIVKMFDPAPGANSYCPVAIYTERPYTVESSYINIENQARYYNQYGGLKGISAEGNAGTADHFSTFLEKAGLGKLAMMRKDLSGKGFSNKKKVFQYVNSDVRDWQMKQAHIFLRKYAHNIQMLMLIENMLLASNENADVLDAWLMWFVAVPDFDKPVVKPSVRKREKTYITRDSNGRTVYKTISLDKPQRP
jgi:hypothetical protein